MSGTRAAPRTSSRYQRGLSYEPGLADSRYRPERMTGGGGGPVTNVGGGVSPIMPPDDDDGVVVPIGGGGGGSLGAIGGGAGLLAALANPNLIRQLGGLLGGSGTAVSGITQGSTSLGAGAAAPAAGAPIDPISALAPEAATQGSTSGLAGTGSGGGGGGAAGGLTGLYGLPIVPFGGAEFGSAVLPAGWGASAGNQVLWSPQPIDLSQFATGGQTVMDGGGTAAALGADLVDDVAGAATGGLEGVMGSGLLGGGFDLLGGLGTLGGGLLGNYVAGQAGYSGDRDPMGQQIGSGLGSAVGGLFLGPIGAFLGAQLGGAIGGQFGPQESVGANWNAGFTWSPELANQVQNSFIASGGTMPTGLTGGFGFQSFSGQDNGGQANMDFANAFQQQLMAMAAAQGYAVNPTAVGAGYAVGQFMPSDSMTAPGQGYFYKAGDDYADNPSRFFGTDLNAQYQPFNGAFSGLFPQSNLTVGQYMLDYAFDDLVRQGLFVPQGQAVSQDAALQQLMGTAQQNFTSGQNYFAQAEQNQSMG
jgi:hypothetical protein